MTTPRNPFEQEFLASYNDGTWPLVTGPVYMGIGVDMLCLGVIFCQFIYWKLRLERDERWPLRALVYWITVGSAAHTAFCQAYGFSIFVQGYGNPLTVVRGWWVKGDCVFELLLAMPIEVMYAFRSYELWHRPRWIKYGLPLVFAGSIAIGIANLFLGDADPVNSTTSHFFIAWVATLFFIDWLLSGLIIVALVKKRSGVSHTDKLLKQVVVWSAEAQLLPSLVTAGLIIKALVAPKSLIVLVFIFVPKVWVICGLAVINMRKTLRQDIEQERQRRQNTLNFLSDEVDGDTSATRNALPHLTHTSYDAGSNGNGKLALPAVSLTTPSDDLLSPISEKGFEVQYQRGTTETYFSGLSSSSGMTSIPVTPPSRGSLAKRSSLESQARQKSDNLPWVGGLNVAGGGRRASSAGVGGVLGFGVGLGRLRSRGPAGGSSSLGDVDDEEGGMADLSFEEMLAWKS